MGELHSLAYSSSLHSSSLGWDFHNLGLPNADTMSLVMDGNAAFFSPLESEFSTGYLEDALVEFGQRTKRRRLLSYDDDQSNGSQDLEKSFWNPNSPWDLSENLYTVSQLNSFNDFSVVGEPTGTPMSQIRGEANIITHIKSPEESPEATDSSSSSYRDLAGIESINKETPVSIAPSGASEKKNKKVITGLVYPFALVKPGGVEGDITLNDINERILMPPTRPVRHPVGDFACRPCVSPDGPGLSGKAVVALTKIHTQGRGTITIIRTKG